MCTNKLASFCMRTQGMLKVGREACDSSFLVRTCTTGIPVPVRIAEADQRAGIHSRVSEVDTLLLALE